jgi:hypothetical protein
LLPAEMLIAVTGGTAAVAVKTTGLPASPVDVAASVFAPTDDPSVHEPTVATPSAFVVAAPPWTVPPPAVGAKVTLTPPTGMFSGSVTITDGAVATAFPGRAV